MSATPSQSLKVPSRLANIRSSRAWSILHPLAMIVVPLWAIATIVFFLSRLGGDPAAMMLPAGTPLEDIERFRVLMGFDRPLFEQYFVFLADALRGDFGASIEDGRPAFTVILERLPASMELALASLVFGIVLGGTAGYVSAVWRGGWIEFFAMSLALLGQATPKFWLGIMLIMVFSVWLGVLPTGGRDSWVHLILPAITLGTFTAATIARFLRSSMLEVLGEDYVRTAWSKGLLPAAVYRKHVLRNALLPIITVLGLLIGESIGNAMIVETIFYWPGVGNTILQAISRKDFAVLQAGVIVLSFIFILTNTIVDLVYTMVDPRIRLT
jgi:peptide/nickel transport system permease protein